MAEYIYLGGRPLAKVQGGTLTYIHSDHLGTPVLMTTASAPVSVVWDIESRPFGDGATITGSGSLDLRFPGQYFDQETGLHQNWWREYHSLIGRYVEPDPLRELPLYPYALNAPTNRTDPAGLFVFNPVVEVVGWWSDNGLTTVEEPRVDFRCHRDGDDCYRLEFTLTVKIVARYSRLCPWFSKPHEQLHVARLPSESRAVCKSTPHTARKGLPLVWRMH